MVEKRYTYDFDGLIKSILSKIGKEKSISKKNKQLIRKFYVDCLADGLSKPRVLYYLSRLYTIAKRLNVDFNKAKESDIKKLLADFVKNGYIPGDGNNKKKVKKKKTKKYYTDNTLNDFRITLKKFFKWQNGGEEYPKAVKFIKIKTVNGQKLPEDILTLEDVEQLLEHTTHTRDRALVNILWETGLRVGELLGVKLKELNFDKDGAVMMVNGKTGQRRVRLITSVNCLSDWLKIHPDKNNREAFLWVNYGNIRNGERLMYNAVRMMLIRAAKDAGIQKKVNPHSFRAASATFYASYLNSFQLNERYGWVQGSKMAAVYVHMNGKQLDDALLRIHGKLPDEEKQKIDRATCPRCKKEHEIGSRYCSECGIPMDLKVAMDLENKHEEFEDNIAPIMEVLKDPEIQKIVANRLSQAL